MRVKLHWAERFMNWFPAHTRLYIRGARGKGWAEQRVLDQELFDQLAPFLDQLRAEAKAEEREECARICERNLGIASSDWRSACDSCARAIHERGKA